MKRIALVVCSIVFLPLSAQAQEPRLDENGLPLTDCPGATSREPLIANRITSVSSRGKNAGNVTTVGDLSVLTEGRNLLVDADSYPRRRGKLTEGPTLLKKDDGYAVRFAVDWYDDVVVRIVDEQGGVARNIACGVLGPNAPEPFRKDSLEQEIAAGEIPAGCTIEVGVGLAPRFEGFIGHDPSQLTPYLRGVTVDRQGRVYVTLSAHRYDPSILRFDRSGTYLETVYPSNPGHLAKLGKTWEDVYDMVEYIDGYPVPIKPSHWRAWIEYWDDFVPMPFAVGPGNKGYMIIGMPNRYGTPLSINARGDVDRLDVIEDLDDFWFWTGRTHPGVYPTMYLQRHDAGFAFEGQGSLLLAARAVSGLHGPQATTQYSGTVRRVDLRTGKNVASFTKGPGNSESAPSCFLRPAWTFRPKDGETSYIDRIQRLVIRDGKEVEPDPKYDSPDRFCDIEDLTVDARGSILVIDGYPRRIKCYGADGAWLGEVPELRIDGRLRRFHDLICIEAVGGHVYLLSSFRDDKDGPVYLVKCNGSAPGLSAVSSVPLDPLARFIAVDTQADKPVVWVGNGGGPATLSRVTDAGDRFADVRHVGGMDNGRALDPATISVDPQQNLYVYDKAREAVLKYDAGGEQTARLDLNPNTMAHYYARYRRFPMQGGKYSAYQDGTRYSFQKVKAIVPDPKRGRVWIQYKTNPAFQGWLDSFPEGKPFLKPFPGLAAYDRDLDRQETSLWDPAEAEMDARSQRLFFANTPRSVGFATEDGSLLCRDGGNRRPGKGRFAGAIRLLKPDGESKTLCDLFHGGSSSLAVDSRGNLYTVDGPSWPEKQDNWGFRFDYTFPTVDMKHWGTRTSEGDEAYSRGDQIVRTEFTYVNGIKQTRESGGHIVRHQAEVSYLVKFGPKGGARGSEAEQWALRGGYLGQVCEGCDTPLNLLACDAADRIVLGDVDHSSVKIIDTAGNVITRFGRYGNAATVPGPDGSAKQLGFRNIYSLTAAGEYVYVCDRDLRRIAKVRMAYRETRMCNTHQRSQ